MTSEQLKAAREWIAECVWMDLEDVSELTDKEVERGVARHYDGGIPAFLNDSRS